MRQPFEHGRAFFATLCRLQLWKNVPRLSGQRRQSEDTTGERELRPGFRVSGLLSTLQSFHLV